MGDCGSNTATARSRHSSLHTGMRERSSVVAMTKATTPWGKTVVVEELAVPQRAGEKRFATIVQLLADAKGDELVRFAYSTGALRDAARSRFAPATSSGSGMVSPSIQAWRALWDSRTGKRKKR
jgi:hypothetical protein